MTNEKTRAEQLEKNIKDVFPASNLEIVNLSHMHQGHSGHDGSGESHFKIVIQAKELENLSRLQQQKLLHQAIGKKLLEKIHSITFQIK